MVASGLPTTNGDKHIKEVADFALAVLVGFYKKFVTETNNFTHIILHVELSHQI